MTLASDLGRGVRHESGTLGVDHRGVVLGLLGAVDVGPGSAVDDGAGTLAGDQPLHLGRIGHVEVVVGQRDT